ncbi:class I SAM-dependent methyltransferase [Candidatus Poribacteria bacterium]
MKKKGRFRGKGLGVGTTYSFEDEPSSMVHEQLARLSFIESHIDMKDKDILDYGCGTGYNCYYICQRHTPARIVGLDIDEECIDYCKKVYSSENAEYCVQDCLEHNQELGIFDIVISCEVIEHVADQQRFLDELTKYVRPNSGTVFISTPNKALFSLSKSSSFINRTHVKELFFNEFEELLSSKFDSYRIFSQVHKGKWHEAYINYLCAANFAHALRYEFFGDNVIGKSVAKIGKCLLYLPMFIMKSRSYANILNRKYTDFEFVEGYDNLAIWFVAICSTPR